MLGIEARAAVDRAGAAAVGERGREVERVRVAQRHDQERGVAPAEAELDLGHEREHRTAAVRPDRALGPPGGAGGVHQRPRIRSGDRNGGLRIARRGDQRFIAEVARGRRRGAAMNVAARLHGQRVADLFDRAQQRVLDDEGARAAIGRDIGDLAPDQAEVDRHGDQPGFGGRGIDLQPLDAVVGQDRDPVALLEPEAAQRVGQPARARVPLAKGHPALEIGRADPLGIEPRVGGQDLAKIQQRQHRPLRAGSPHQTACLAEVKGASSNHVALGAQRPTSRLWATFGLTTPRRSWASQAVTARPAARDTRSMPLPDVHLGIRRALIARHILSR